MILLRSLLFQLWFWTTSILLNIIWLPSLVLPRAALLRGQKIWAATTMWGLKHIVGLDYEVRGREHIQPGAALYAGKHFSMWETLAIQLILKDPAAILKRELTWIPVFGWFLLKSEQVVVNRSAHAKALRQMLATAKSRIAAGREIVIFPEGTRKPVGVPPDYKSGVAALYGALDVPCVPVALNSGLYWMRKGPIRKPGTIVIEFLPPIPPGLKRREFMTELERTVEAASARLLAEGGFTPEPAHAR